MHNYKFNGKLIPAHKVISIDGKRSEIKDNKNKNKKKKWYCKYSCI